MKRALHSKRPSNSNVQGTRTDTAVLTYSPHASTGTLERELELQRILATESRRHAEELEESYAQILASKDALLAGLGADYADLAAQLRVTRKELRLAKTQAEDSSLRGELRALEAELDEQYQLLTHAARNAVENINRMGALVHENAALRNERGDLEERNALAARIEALESTRLETDEQRAFEANVLEHLRDELADVTTYTTASNSPDLAVPDADLRSGSTSPLMHLPNTSAFSLLDEDLPASLPLSPRSPTYTPCASSSPPRRHATPIRLAWPIPARPLFMPG